MNDRQFSRLEAQLERLIEGAFTQVFARSIRAHDIALQLSRAMEHGALDGDAGDARRVAPDIYAIRMNPTVRAHLLSRQPALVTLLRQHMIELATFAGYRLNGEPEIQIIGDIDLSPTDLYVDTAHISQTHNITSAMERVDFPDGVQHQPHNPQLIINGQRTVPLVDELINIGRGRDNHIVLDDPYVSRHHMQLRLRFGMYTLFDTNSHGGTHVNDVVVREHRLQPGDVIRLGRTQMVYLEDPPPWDQPTNGGTAVLG
jgi:hypothetical protein